MFKALTKLPVIQAQKGMSASEEFTRPTDPEAHTHHTSSHLHLLPQVHSHSLSLTHTHTGTLEFKARKDWEGHELN